MTDPKIIESLLSRGVEEVIDKTHLAQALASGKKLRIKLGIDPTAPDLHLGHAVALRKLKAFQDAGHTIVLIIGDFTGRIGDPSGRSDARTPLTEKAVKVNMQAYLKQAGKILNLRKAEIFYNSKWFMKEGVQKILELASIGTMQQVLHRADFAKRIAAEKGVTMLEALYPLFQGYDSVKVKADLEVGGTDQKFNLLMGRELQRHYELSQQDVLMVPLLIGLDGERKMSKSYDNYIALNDTPEDMFGKIMSLPDALMTHYFILCTELSEKELEDLGSSLSPRDLKARLGFEIVKLYYGEKKAKIAQETFDKVFSKKEIPEDAPALEVKSPISALDLVLASNAAKSKSDAWRLIEGGGLSLGKTSVKNPREILILHEGDAVTIGKKRFFRISLG
ncbi:MAG: tyrosine--tRNA ligase [bacterium]|nr:tyrosine--tRNA ligase [bacterium]